MSKFGDRVVTTPDGTDLPAKMNNRVFVDGLPFQHDNVEDELARFVHEWKVGRVMKILKKPGQGFGYIVFRSPNSVDVAINVLNGKRFMGRALRVELPRTMKEKGAEGPMQHVQSSVSRQVLLSDLNAAVTPQIMRDVIKEYNTSLEKKIEHVKPAGKSGRKAFVTMKSEEDVEPFIEFIHGFSLLGRGVVAERAQAPGTLPFSQPKNLPVREKKAGESSAIDDAIAAATSTTVAMQGGPATPAPMKQTTPLPRVVNDNGPKEIIVGNLTEETTKAQVLAHFSHSGTVKDCEIFINPHTLSSMGIARVVYATSGQARLAKERMNNSRLNGNVLRVDRGDEKPEEPTNAVDAGEEDDFEVVADAPPKRLQMRTHGSPKALKELATKKLQKKERKLAAKREAHGEVKRPLKPSKQRKTE